MKEKLRKLHKHFPGLTLAQMIVALEAAEHFERTGEPHTVISLTKACDMTMSSGSRVVYTLTKDGGRAINALQLKPDAKDRRLKRVVPNTQSQLLKILLS